MAMSILGIGTVCALGSGIESFKSGLLGENKPLIEEYLISTETGEIILPVYKPITAGIDRFIPGRALRRIDSFSQMALLSTYLSIEDSGIQFEDKKRVGIVFGSSYGPSRTTFKLLDAIIDDGDKGASPTYFANSVHNALSSHASIFLKITGPCTTITCFNHTLSNVLLTAANWLKEDVVDYVLAGAGDEYCDVLGYAAAGFRGSDKKLLPPGEGHITFVLSNDSFAKGKYGKIDEIIVRKKASEIDIESPGSPDAVFLSSNGTVLEESSFSEIDLKHAKVADYTSLYGKMPAGSGFNIAAAAISLKEKTLYPSPVTNTQYDIQSNIISKKENLKGHARISCIEFGDRDEFNFYVLSC